MIALLGFAGMFYGLRFKTETLTKDSGDMKHDLKELVDQLNVMLRQMEVANGAQAIVNATVTKTLESVVRKLDEIDKRVQVNETAIMVLKGECPLLHELKAKLEEKG